MKHIYAISTALTLVCATSTFAVDKTVVLDTYADIAATKYQDSLITAQTLGAAVDALLATPSAEALQPPKRLGWRRVSLTNKRKCIVLAIPSSMIGKAR
jgi:putative iron-regulated protein